MDVVFKSQSVGVRDYEAEAGVTSVTVQTSAHATGEATAFVALVTRYSSIYYGAWARQSASPDNVHLAVENARSQAFEKLNARRSATMAA
jgi:hypothetical protein